MARRPNHLHPQPCLHRASGHGRVRISGQTYWLGRHGSAEAAAEYDRLIGEWLAGGKAHPPSRRTKAVPTSVTGDTANRTAANSEEPPIKSATRTNSQSSACQEVPVTHGTTVGELCTNWLNCIERTRCHRGKDSTSLYYGARQVAAALEDFWSLPAASFGSRNLVQVQEKLVRTPVVSRPKDPSKSPKIRPRYRSTVNDTVNRIRQMFRWGVIQEIVPEDRIPILQLVPFLCQGQTTAPDHSGERTVADEIVNATLPALSAVVADLVRFQRLVGCRPGEARRLRPCDIDMRDVAAHNGAWVWKPYRHKNQWRKNHLPRLIAIGPKAQAILRPWLEKLTGTPEAHVFSPRFAERRANGGKRKTTQDSPRASTARRPVNDLYSKDSVNRAIERACRRAHVPKWTANQLRHTRLTEIRDAVSPDAAQAVGGHASITQTEHYARVLLAKATDAAARSG